MERARLRNSDLKGFLQFTKLNIIISVFQYFLFRVQVHKTFQSHIQYFWHIVAALVVLYRHNCKKLKMRLSAPSPVFCIIAQLAVLLPAFLWLTSCKISELILQMLSVHPSGTEEHSLICKEKRTTATRLWVTTSGETLNNMKIISRITKSLFQAEPMLDPWVQ